MTKITVEQGDRVRFRARASEDDEVHVHGYDRITGIFEIEFEHSGTHIGELRVEPR